MNNNACFCTGYLPESLKTNLGRGLEARYIELWRDRNAGYGSDMTAGMREKLASDARQAHALGLIPYLPQWARLND